MKFLAPLLILFASASATAPTHHLMEQLHSTPTAWIRTAPSHPEKYVDLTFFIKLDSSTMSNLESELLSRSDPTNTKFAQWLSNDEVQALAAPPSASVAAVFDYIDSLGLGLQVVPRTANGDVLTVAVPVEVANKILLADYHMFTHSVTGHAIHRTESYSLPVELKEHVSLVGPTTRFPHPSSSLRALSDPPSDAASLNSPSVLRSLYDVNSAVGGASPSNKQAVTAFLGQLYSASDLAQFFKTLLPLATSTPITLVGDATTGGAGVESMLDIEYMPAMGALNPTGFWGFSGSSPIDAADEPFLTWLYVVSNTTDEEVPLVFSTSYGEEEVSEVPTDYSDRINAEFIKAGLRGISLLFASGDSGAVTMSHTCPGSKFSPKWPAGSPYVTAVGGTNGGSSLPESAWSGSSGGFSNIFPVPSWQANATAAYLSNTDANMPPSSYFNKGGRGFPDISAAAINFPVIVNGRQQSVAGTSCASPTAGGIVGLLNDKRLAAGKASLGFLNQILYANPGAMNDVESGTSEGCVLGQKGWPAKSGWDAVTGLGSMSYERMLEVVMALP